MANVSDVAKYILTLADEEAGDLISNLKLQKLVYYCQGFHLALVSQPLFKENIDAWEHGPVVPMLYKEYKDFGAGSIPIPEGFSDDVLSSDEKDLIDEVYEVYGQFSAWKLRNMTHEEDPWKNTLRGDTINHDIIREYFLTQVN